MRRLLPLLVIAVLVSTVVAAPAHALGAFDPPVEVVDPGCRFNDVAGDVAYGGDGDAHGFVTFFGGACGSTKTVWYFEGGADGGSWTRAASPYTGIVLATAWDTTGSYVLYQSADGMRIGKRANDGTFSGGRLMTGHGVVMADLVARGGRWWAVWSETFGTGRHAQADLFQAGTLSTPIRARERILRHPDYDLTPSLALSPAGDTMVLFWARGRQRTVLQRATGDFSGRWLAQRFSREGEVDFQPDVAVTASRVYVAWQRLLSGRLVEADNNGGRFAPHLFATSGSEPRVRLDGGLIFVGWTTDTDPARVFVAERTGSAWSGRYASVEGLPRDQDLVGLVSEGGNVTALIASIGMRLYATTES